MLTVVQLFVKTKTGDVAMQYNMYSGDSQRAVHLAATAYNGEIARLGKYWRTAMSEENPQLDELLAGIEAKT